MFCEAQNNSHESPRTVSGNSTDAVGDYQTLKHRTVPALTFRDNRGLGQSPYYTFVTDVIETKNPDKLSNSVPSPRSTRANIQFHPCHYCPNVAECSAHGCAWDAESEAVSFVVSVRASWGKAYQWRETAPAKSLRRFAEILRSSNLSRLLAKGLSGFLDSRKGCQKTSQPPQFITSQANLSAPVTTGAKARLILHPARSSSYFIRTPAGLSSNTSCAAAKRIGGRKFCAPSDVLRLTSKSANSLNSICGEAA